MNRTLPAPDMDERVRQLNRRIKAGKDRPSDYYEMVNWCCELRPYLSQAILMECRRRGNPLVLELHHVAGRGKYAEVAGNWISVSQPVHSWLTDHSKPGFVLCAFAKWKKNETDWFAWSSLKPTYRLTWLETEDCIEACRPYPCVERMRLELLERSK